MLLSPLPSLFVVTLHWFIAISRAPLVPSVGWMGRGAAGALGTFTLERRKNESASKRKRTVTQIYKEHQHCPRRGRKPQYEGKAYRKGLPRDINVWLTERLEDRLTQWLNGWSGTERLCDWMAMARRAASPRFTALPLYGHFFWPEFLWNKTFLTQLFFETLLFPSTDPLSCW